MIAFNPYESINPISLGRSFRVATEGDLAAQPCSLIVKALQRDGKAAVARCSPCDRTRLGLLPLTAVSNARIEGKEVPPMDEAASHAPVVELMAAPNESVAAALASRGQTGEGASVRQMPAAKSRTAKNPAAAKNATANEAPSRRRAGPSPAAPEAWPPESRGV